LVITTVTLLLLPELSPWLLLWILPYMVFIPKWSWLGFTLLIQLSYLLPGRGALPWMLAIYLPFFVLLLAEYYDRRKVKGWFL
jgi:hypothetical protein